MGLEGKGTTLLKCSNLKLFLKGPNKSLKREAERPCSQSYGQGEHCLMVLRICDYHNLLYNYTILLYTNTIIYNIYILTKEEKRKQRKERKLKQKQNRNKTKIEEKKKPPYPPQPWGLREVLPFIGQKESKGEKRK